MLRQAGLVLGIAAVIAACQRAEAAPLLTSAYESKLEGWLGEGNLNFTNVFTKDTANPSANDSFDFHAAADGQGRTFTLLEVLAQNNHAYQVIGGYNPQSWNSSGNYNYTPTDAERTAFLFNLTTDELQRQKLTTDANGSLGVYQRVRPRGVYHGCGWPVVIAPAGATDAPPAPISHPLS